MGTSGWGESCMHREGTSSPPWCEWSKAVMDQHARRRPDKATSLPITLARGGDLSPLSSSSLPAPQRACSKRTCASPSAGWWPAGLPASACLCLSWASCDTPLRGGDRLCHQTVLPRQCGAGDAARRQPVLSSWGRGNWSPFPGN